MTWALRSEGITDRSANALAFDASARTLYVATDNGVFRSSDGAERWAQAREGLGMKTRINALALDPANPRVLYASNGLDVFRSADGAAMWTPIRKDFQVNTSIGGLFGLVVVPGTPETVFVGVDRFLWRSAEGNTTFEKCCTSIPLARVQAMVYDPSTKAVYAGTDGEGVWKSADGGVSWVEARAGLSNANVQALVIDPSSPATLYAATWKKGVYRTSDGGKSWTRVGGDPPHPDVMALALDPAGPGRVIVGMSGGSVWRLDATAVEPPATAPARTPAAPPAKKR